jgi:flavin-dependent dehydrogenase
MHRPNGRAITVPFPMLNFMRYSFDEWLCLLAQSYGAEFRDGCCLDEFEETDDGIILHIRTAEGTESIKARYVIDATGMRPAIRRKLRPTSGFRENKPMASLNYYFSADGNLQPDKLYQFWNIEYNKSMFAWVYNKTLQDGHDYWVIGTVYDQDIRQRLDRFFDDVKALYHLTNVRIVKQEGYSSTMSFTDEGMIWLGERNILIVGDAAGLIDPKRGVGMDAAALSGRLAAKAIGLARASGEPVGVIYARLMRRVVDQTRRNQQHGIASLHTNDELQAYLDQGFVKLGLNMVFQSLGNMFRGAEQQVLLP